MSTSHQTVNLSDSGVPDPSNVDGTGQRHVSHWHVPSKHGYELHYSIHHAPGDSAAPWLLHSHGGAGMSGSHLNPKPWMIEDTQLKGVTLVETSYGLMPNVTVDQQLDDVNTIWEHVRENANTYNIDKNKYAVAGTSYGGLLALWQGSTLSPKPCGVVSISGITDFADKWFNGEKKEDGTAMTLKWPDVSGKYTEAQLEEASQNHDAEKALVFVPFRKAITDEDLKLMGLPVSALESMEKARGLQADLTIYTMTEPDRWRKTILRRPEGLTAEEVERYAKPISAFTSDCSPVLFIHGTADDLVHIRQSTDAAEKLKKLGVEALVAKVEDEGHIMGWNWTNAEGGPGAEARQIFREFLTSRFGLGTSEISQAPQVTTRGP